MAQMTPRLGDVDALSLELQRLLCDLSVLTGRFTLDDARAVAGAEGAPSAAIIETVGDFWDFERSYVEEEYLSPQRLVRGPR